MERESAYLLHLLRAYLHEEKPEPRPDIDWENLMNLAQIHSVTGIVAYMAVAHGLGLDAGKIASLRRTCFTTIGTFTQRSSMADQLFGKLAENGIDHIRMKGHVVRNYYPVPELRTFGDIDFVIRREDREKCHELMLALGFESKDDWEPVYSYSKGPEYYEIHTELLEVDVSDQADYLGYFRQMWKFAESSHPHRYEFKPEFHFLYMLTHIAKHIRGAGAGVRMYLDVAAFVKYFGGALDWDWITGELQTLKLMNFACSVFSAVECWFGVPSPVPCRRISDPLLKEFTEYTLEAGVFGHHNRENAVNSLKNAEHESFISRIRFFLRRLFPAADTIARRYTYLQKYPWLLPVAWIHRLIITRSSFSAHTHEAEVIFSAESDEIRRLQRITKNIGL